MSILPGRHRAQHTVLNERCDACSAPGQIRVGKHIAVLREFQDHPHAVDSRELDLVLCVVHFDRHHGALSTQGWRLIEASR